MVVATAAAACSNNRLACMPWRRPASTIRHSSLVGYRARRTKNKTAEIAYLLLSWQQAHHARQSYFQSERRRPRKQLFQQ